MDKSLAAFLEKKAIQHVPIPPDVHTQNGRVERAHLTLANNMRTLLIDSGLPQRFWAEAIAYSTYVRSKTMVNKDGQTPEEQSTQQPGPIDHIQPFGQRLIFRVHQQQSKLEPRYLPGKLVGFMIVSHLQRLNSPVPHDSRCRIQN